MARARRRPAVRRTLTNDPQGAGPHEWLGWHDPADIRRRRAVAGFLADNGGTLLVVRGGSRIGIIS
jgi:hypothetical protein